MFSYRLCIRSVHTTCPYLHSWHSGHITRSRIVTGKYPIGTVSGPSAGPTRSPTENPTDSPCTEPTVDPTGSPAERPSDIPSTDPTVSPSADPTRSPTSDPTAGPAIEPNADPTAAPTGSPKASGDYNDEDLIFEVRMTHDGDMIFDASGSDFEIASLEALTVKATDDDGDGIITMMDLEYGMDISIQMSADKGTYGTWSVSVICTSDSPTRTPSESPSELPTGSVFSVFMFFRL